MAQQSVGGQLEGIPFSGHLGRGCAASSTDGLWARLRGGAKRVVLILAGGAAEPLDSASGLLWPPVVVDMAKPVEAGEESRRSWRRLRPFSTGCLFQRAKVVDMAKPAAAELVAEGAARRASKQLQGELVALIRGVLPALTGCPGDANDTTEDLVRAPSK